MKHSCNTVFLIMFIKMNILLKTTTLLILSMNNIFAQGFVLEQDQRIKDGDFYYEHTDLTYLISKYSLLKKDKFDLNVTPFVGYRLIYEEKGEEFKTYSRFLAGAHIGVANKDWGKVVFRNRYEFTPGEWMGNLNTKNDNRFRERIKYYFPISFTKYKITPNITEEFFFDIDNGFEYDRNRLGGGIGAKIGNFSPEIYYFAEFKKSSNWNKKDVFGFLIKYNF